jgi:GT2 family glycosyltransferase
METVSIIMPTYDNLQYLGEAVQSIINTRAHEELLKIYIVDNGTNKVRNLLTGAYDPFVKIIETGKNLGWEGGLKEGLKHVPKGVEFVMFANDDIFIPRSSLFWLTDMLQWFKSPKIAAVGPISNTVMGVQNMKFQTVPKDLSVEYLIGFCMLVRKKALYEVGGIDDTLPGGDDLDLSIRLKDKGYTLLVDRTVFVYHYGFKTGERLHGDYTKANGWNSYEQYHATNTALIKKHGFARWQRIQMNQVCDFKASIYWEHGEDEIYDKLITSKFKRIFDLGCGANKTVKQAIGFDIFPKGVAIPTLSGVSLSQADIVADVSKPLPEKNADMIVARHILEHMIDPADALTNWKNALKSGGTLLVAVPNELISQTIPINKEHKHAFTPESLKRLMELTGFTEIEWYNPNNFISFVMKGVKP